MLQLQASLVAQRVENLPAVQESWVLSLGREDPPGERNPLHYHGSENSMDCIVHGVTESDSAERLSLAAAACLISRPYLHLSQEGHLMKGIRVSLGLNTFLYRVLVRCNSHII